MDKIWADFIAAESAKPYFAKLCEFIDAQRAQNEVYPPAPQVFAAFERVPYDSARVVILGQDPYHHPGAAHGLAFSVNPGVRIPPSLRNIFKELVTDLGCDMPKSGYLMPWADQGVMLFSAVLTVSAGVANSHRKQGWEIFTDAAIARLSQRELPLVFMLWGRAAQQKSALIHPRHLILTAPHPSPLARGGFFGCRHFSRANAFLKSTGQPPINWQISP